jgi:hypothetical protein
MLQHLLKRDYNTEMIKNTLRRMLDRPNFYSLSDGLLCAGVDEATVSKIVQLAEKHYCTLEAKKHLVRIFVRGAAGREERLSLVELAPWIFKNIHDRTLFEGVTMSSQEFMSHLAID